MAALGRAASRTPTPSSTSRTPYELLVATILSAQCTDERVNQVTPALFKRYPDARGARQGDDRRARAADPVHRLLPRQIAIAHRHGDGARRAATAARCRRRWRRSSSCRASAARPPTSCSATRSACPGLPVDRHVLRVVNRIGIAQSDDPEVVEQQLCAAMPPADWTRTSDTLILHGRRICKPRPLCEQLRGHATTATTSARWCAAGPRAGARRAQEAEAAERRSATHGRGGAK